RGARPVRPKGRNRTAVAPPDRRIVRLGDAGAADVDHRDRAVHPGAVRVRLWPLRTDQADEPHRLRLEEAGIRAEQDRRGNPAKVYRRARELAQLAWSGRSGRLRRRRPSDPPGQARWTLVAARTALRASRGVRARPAEPARRDRPGDRTDPHHGCPDRGCGKHDRPVRGAGARQLDDEPHPRFPRQRPLPPRQSRHGLAATAGEAHRPALRAVLLPAPQPDRAPVESDARERHSQQVLRQIPRLRPSRARVPARNRASPVRRILVVHHRQFPRHQPQGFSDPRVTPLYPQYKLVTGGNVVNKLFPLALAALCLTAPASAQITSFQHVIVVVQENRTPDDMFQGLCTTPTACSTRPGPGQYNIQTTAWLDKTGTTNPKAVPFGLGYDMLHAHSAFVTECDL